MAIITVLFLVALPVQAFANAGVPFLLWKSTGSSAVLPDFQQLLSITVESGYHAFLSSMNFETLVVFLMNELNVEDFSGYPGVLSQLEREFESSENVFAPSMPSLRMEQLASFNRINVNVSDPSPLRLVDGPSKTLLLASLSDRPAADRHQILLQADHTIAQVLGEVKSLTDSYVAVLTGRFTSMGGEIETRPIRSLKAASPDKPTNQHHLFLNLGCMLLYTSDSPVLHFQSLKQTAAQGALTLPLGSPSSNTSSCNGTDVNTATVVWQHANSTGVDLAGVTLQLTFRANMTRPGGSDVSFWRLSEVTLTYAGNVEDKAVSKAVVALDFDDVYAPRHFSYHCTSRMWAAEPSVNSTNSDAPMLTALQLPGFQVSSSPRAPGGLHVVI